MRIEEIAWKKDETPYLVFPCAKCRQYTYVKTTQKTKKCVRCGHSHLVTRLIEGGDIVKGISNAVDVVKKRQDELALKELGSHPEFRALNDFKVTNSLKSQKNNHDQMIENENCNNYIKMLIEISDQYDEFPFYLIEIMAEKYRIPDSEIKILTRNFLNRGKLIKLKNSLLKLNF